MVRIVWGYLPCEVRQAVRPLIVDYLFLLPTWVHELRVQYCILDHEQPGTTASMNSNPSYRDVTLTIHARWLDESPEKRRRVIRHEMLHPNTAPLLVVARDLVKHLVDTSSPLFAIATENIRATVEGATVDMERALDCVTVPSPLPFLEEEDEQAPAAEQPGRPDGRRAA